MPICSLSHDPALAASPVLVLQPVAGATQLQAGIVDDQMEIVSAAMGFGVNLQLPHPAAQDRMIGHGKIEPEPVHD